MVKLGGEGALVKEKEPFQTPLLIKDFKKLVFQFYWMAPSWMALARITINFALSTPILDFGHSLSTQRPLAEFQNGIKVRGRHSRVWLRHRQGSFAIEALQISFTDVVHFDLISSIKERQVPSLFNSNSFLFTGSAHSE